MYRDCMNEVLDQALINVICTSAYFADQFKGKHREFLRKVYISDLIRPTHTITERVWPQHTHLRFWSFEKYLLELIKWIPVPSN